MKILVAEDDQIAGHILVKILESLGYESVWFQNGREALEGFQAEPYQIVVSDCMMPGMDGIELCKRIRALNLPFYTYYILLTAKIPPSDGCKVLATGIDAFISKPLNKRELMAKLNVAQNIIQSYQRCQTA